MNIQQRRGHCVVDFSFSHTGATAGYSWKLPLSNGNLEVIRPHTVLTPTPPPHMPPTWLHWFYRIKSEVVANENESHICMSFTPCVVTGGGWGRLSGPWLNADYGEVNRQCDIKCLTPCFMSIYRAVELSLSSPPHTQITVFAQSKTRAQYFWA